jgi:hypothetical protein
MDPHVIEKIQAYYASLPPDEFPLMLAGLQCKPMADWGITFDFCIRTFAAGLMAAYGSGKGKPAEGDRTPPAG